MFPGFRYDELLQMDVRECRAWEAEAKFRRARRQIDAIRAQQFVWMEQGDRERVMEELLETVRAHERRLEPERSPEEERKRVIANIRRAKQALGGR